MSSLHLREWRQFRHLTMDELADAVGTTKSVLCRLESGMMGVSEKWMRRLALALNCQPGDLFERPATLQVGPTPGPHAPMAPLAKPTWLLVAESLVYAVVRGIVSGFRGSGPDLREAA